MIAWRYLGAGIGDSSVQGPYRGKRTRRTPVASGSPGIDGFATVMQTVPAMSLRGRTIRFRGLVRAASREASGAAALWLRIDRPDQQMGFFDNMGDRPIRDPEWKEYAIEGPVAQDATSIAFGVMAFGVVTADFERIELAVRAEDGAWTPIAIEDAGFEAGNDLSGGWRRAGTSMNVEITRPAERALDGRQFLRMSPRSSSAPTTTQLSTSELFESPPRTGAHGDVDLGLGLRARVALALAEGEAVETRKVRTLSRGCERRSPAAQTPATSPIWIHDSPTSSSRGTCSAISIRIGPRQVSTGMRASGHSWSLRTMRRRARPIATRCACWWRICVTDMVCCRSTRRW